MMNIGDKLYELRKAKGLTQDEVAAQINVSRQTVSKWESNMSAPDFDKIIPLCNLYDITPNELILDMKEEKQEEQKEVVKDVVEEKEITNHIFSNKRLNYETMSDSQINQRSGEVVSSSILIFFVAVSLCAIGVTVLRWNPVVMGCTMMVLIGIGVARIVKHYMSIPPREKSVEERKKDKIQREIQGIIGAIGIAIYFIVSFTTMAWHITWVIFIIIGLANQIVRLIMMLQEGEKDEV